MSSTTDTICAVATPSGRGGISIIRISGPLSAQLCAVLTNKPPPLQTAMLANLKDDDGSLIDQGLVLFFKGPHSFTGEDVCELHTHGSPVVTDLLLNRLVRHGARLARPGEFSERAFLNDKIDLAQAEAIADLINSATVSAAKLAVRSLQGEFSLQINVLVSNLTSLRIYIEAALDFPGEEVDFLADGAIEKKIDALHEQLVGVLTKARQGALVREGIRVAIAGEPNAGKSTLLNTLCGEEAAIVTDIPGTTRDILRQAIDIDGLPIHILDTAGLRDSPDPVEQEGIKRARAAMMDADLVLLMLDVRHLPSLEQLPVWAELTGNVYLKSKILLVLNKIDLISQQPGEFAISGVPAISISAKQHYGLELLREKLKVQAGYITNEEGGFLARRRHVLALEEAGRHIDAASIQLKDAKASELVAEELKLAQEALGEITGKVSSDELLGRIFSSFCIGK